MIQGKRVEDTHDQIAREEHPPSMDPDVHEAPMRAAPAPTDVYRYEDYRSFLKDRFEELQARDPAFSQRGLSRKAGIANPGFFNEVIKGRRKLSLAATEKMARGLTLPPADAKYLSLMVAYNESRDPRMRESLCQQMIFRRNRKFVERLSLRREGYGENPAYPVVKAAIAACDFSGDFEKLSQFIWPAIPAQAVKKCVLDLCEWGLVEQDAGAGYRLADPSRIPWESAQEAMDMHVHPPRGAHLTSDIVSVSDRTYRRILEKLMDTREQVLQWLKEDEEPAIRVAQVNLQLLPRSWSVDPAE